MAKIEKWSMSSGGDLCGDPSRVLRSNLRSMQTSRHRTSCHIQLHVICIGIGNVNDYELDKYNVH